ncbi:MAG: hypothetical protein HY398_01790 [Candidatus Doudnabacteria bacterium]|nr:hypothetical protein [Candidatus Doudnabacteria bacterium]
MNLGQLLVQIFVVVIFFGILYSLKKTTQVYGGLIGAALNWIGMGIVFFSIEALDRVLGNLSFISSIAGGYAPMVHNLVLLLGLVFSTVGFSKLTKIAK